MAQLSETSQAAQCSELLGTKTSGNWVGNAFFSKSLQNYCLALYKRQRPSEEGRCSDLTKYGQLEPKRPALVHEEAVPKESITSCRKESGSGRTPRHLGSSCQRNPTFASVQN